MRHSLFIFLLFFYTHQLFSQKTSAKPWVNSSKDTEWVRNEDFEAKGKGIGRVSDLNEASGIAASFANPGCIWGHNDSGNPARISLIDAKDGSGAGILNLDPIINCDWEDIACIQDQDKQKSYIYLADIGDNAEKKDFVTIHILLDEKMPPGDYLEAKIQKTIQFTYPKGPKDAEAIMVDPLSKDIYIVSKRDKWAGLYTIEYPYKENGIDTATYLGKFPFNQVTAGSISPDGMEILIRSYGRIFYWKRQQGASISETLRRNPQLASYYPIEPQGEAICWDIQGAGYFTLSEKRRKQMPDPTLFFYRRLKN